MAETKQTKSTSTEGTGDSKLNFCCGNFEEMSRMMQEFCGGEKGTFDCGAMMEKMCGSAPKESDRQ